MILNRMMSDTLGEPRPQPLPCVGHQAGEPRVGHKLRDVGELSRWIAHELHPRFELLLLRFCHLTVASGMDRSQSVTELSNQLQSAVLAME